LVALKLWAWLNSKAGIRTYQEVLEELEGHGSRRNVQRWLRRFQPRAMGIQQAIRLAVIERCEPRPLERIFPAGLDPPESVRRKRWQDGSMVGRLWTGLALLLGAACDLNLPVPILLAEARGRCAEIVIE
jgi:hypothetical protein